MSESTISLALYAVIPGILVTIAVGGFMIFTGSVEAETYRQYSILVKVIAVAICSSVIIVGIVMKFYTESGSINLNWVISGSIGLVMIVSMLFD